MVFGRSKEVFSFVIERIWKKLKGWKEKVLSGVGREILIKLVVQEILNYIISCYKFPEGCCEHIKRMITKF